MEDNYAKSLLRKYAAGDCTPEEAALVESWYNQHPHGAVKDLDKKERRSDMAEIRNLLLSDIKNPQTQKPVRRLWQPIAAAASLLIGISVCSYFILRPKTVQVATAYHNDIAPGHNQATLTLANGKKILLTKGLKGTLATQGTTIIQADGNDISYQEKDKELHVANNTLATARGEQSPYPLVLADGTKVWLNGESSITFPTAFPGKERIVKITGQAYFEVAHDANHPFKVQTPTQTIEDIGTAFDVNAYADEQITRTTLVEGSVKVNKIILQPGEQTDGTHILIVNTAEVTAWKNGNFRFTNENIQIVMRQLARWYDIDVVYTGTITNEGFNAKISRNQNISVILSALERTNGVHFKIEGRRVTIIK